MITKIAFIGHPTRDIAKAREFYGDVLGLEASAHYEDHWSEVCAPDGKAIALDTFAPQFSDSPSVYMALETDDIEAEVERLRGRGVQIVHEVFTNKHEDGTEVCKMAIILDHDGHRIVLHQIAAHRA